MHLYGRSTGGDVALDPLALCRQLYAELERLEAGEAVRFPDFIAALQATGAAEGKVAALRAVHHGRFPDNQSCGGHPIGGGTRAFPQKIKYN